MSSAIAERDRAGRPRARVRRWVVMTGIALAVIGAGTITATTLTAASGGSQTPTPKATSTARVQRTDLAETTPVTGTVGFASPYTIVEPAGTSSAALTQARQAAAQAQGTLAADDKARADAAASDGQSVAQSQQASAFAQAALTADSIQLQNDQATLAAAQQKETTDCADTASAGSGSAGPGQPVGSTPCAQDASEVDTYQQRVAGDQQRVSGDQAAVQSAQGQVTAAQLKRSQDADAGQAKVTADQLALADADATLATAQTAATAYDPTSRYTTLPAVGEVIRPGESLWAVDGQAVPLLPGALTPWRAFRPGMPDGPDIAALDRALVDLGDGDGLTVSNAFTDATAAAIVRLQRAVGLPQTGSLALGSVVFAPNPVRVTLVHPLLGSSVGGGQPVLDVTSTTAVVNVALPVSDTYRVKVGDPVSVNLPDGSTGQGTITAVGTVATNTTPANSGSNNTSATVNVTVSLTTASPAGSLDQAPVTVNITDSSVHQVLAVPTTALLALAGGGYAVEVIAPDGTNHLVGVTTGIFDDQSGMVEISGSGLAPGQQVVAAA